MRPAKSDREPYHHGALPAALIAAAESLLADRGAEGFTLRECARRAGVSHAAPAHHFGDTTGLLTAVATVGFERLTAAMLASHAGVAPGWPTLQATGMAYVDTAYAHPAAFKLMFSSQLIDREQPAFAAAAGAAYGVLVDTLAKAYAAEGREPPGPASAAANLSWSAVHGLAFLLIERRAGFARRADWRRHVGDTVALLVAGLAQARNDENIATNTP